MARRHTTSIARSVPAVAVVGQGNHALNTVALFVGGGWSVTVFTPDRDLEERLALYPGVTVHAVDPDYERPPPGLPDCPYFVCVDQEAVARRIKAWLPRTLGVFHVAHERRGHTAAKGFRSLNEPPSLLRRRLQRRLQSIRRVDALIDLVRRSHRPLVLLYGDPDPDAIGAALGLTAIWRQTGAKPLLRYTGEVQRYQNRLLLQYLREDFRRLGRSELAGADLVAVVDAQPGFWRETPPRADIVIDHHPRLPGLAAAFVDLRDDYGSTCTILTEYLLDSDLPIPRRLATALLYGLISDTDSLQRKAGPTDIAAFDALFPRADQHFMARLLKSQVPADMLDRIAWGIRHRLVHRDLMLVHFGEIDNPDLLVQVADLLLLTNGIYWVVVAGVHDGHLTVILRGDGHRQDVGARAKAAFGRIGSAGGHRTMGRAEIPLAGADVDTSCEILVRHLFKRMSPARRAAFVRSLRQRLRHEP